MKIRFAIVGCGRIAPRHAESLIQLPEAELVAAVDVDQLRVERFSAKYQARAFASIGELIEWGEFDVACICTPSGLHAEHATLFFSAKKSVIVEKPMALRLEDADAMIQASMRAGTRLFVVKQNRFNLPVIAARKALDQGRFGKLTLGTVRVRWSRDQAYYDQAPWRGTWALDGGVFANQASHHIDLLEWFMGDVESVFAKTSRQLVNIECEDTGLAILKFKSGAMGMIEATTATRPKDLEGSLSILGERGSVEIGGFAVNKMRHFNFTEPRPEDAGILATQSENPPSVYGFGHLAYFQNVVDSLSNRAPALVDGAEGWKSLELINALYVSAETGAEVRLERATAASRLGCSEDA